MSYILSAEIVSAMSYGPQANLNMHWFLRSIGLLRRISFSLYKYGARWRMVLREKPTNTHWESARYMPI